MNIQATHFIRGGGRYRQKGAVSTLIALIVLVISLLAAMALMRSVDTSTTIASSLTFRQAVLQEAERAYVDAQQNITFAQPASDNDIPGLGYYAEPQPATARSAGDVPNVLVNKVSRSIATVKALNANDNVVTYVVERLCPTSGAASATTCVVPGASLLGGSSSNQSSDNLTPFDNGAYAAFRLTVRVDGPKGAIAYVQTVMR